MKKYRFILTLSILLLSQLAHGQSTLPEKSKQAQVYLEARSDIAREALRLIGIDSITVDKKAGGFYDVGYKFTVNSIDTNIAPSASYTGFNVTTYFTNPKLSMEVINEYNSNITAGKLSYPFGQSRVATLISVIEVAGGITLDNVVYELESHLYGIKQVSRLIEKGR